MTGQVKQVFVEHPLDSIHPLARKAGEAALCAGAQGAEFFWAMHERLFEKASDWSTTEDASGSFRQYAAELGLDEATFSACLESGEKGSAVQAQLELGQDQGVSSVPAFFVNDWLISGAQPFSVFEEVINAALAGEHPPPTPTPLPPGASPFDVNPSRSGYTYGGDITKGSPDAKVVILIFIDFASEDNAAYVAQTWPELLSRYVDPGSIRVAIKHFVAADSPQGLRAAVAAECAGQQDRFWQMYDLLFRIQGEWKAAEDIDGVLGGYAAELGLAADAFSTCVQGDEVLQKVELDIAIAQRNSLPPAPQFVLFFGEQATVVTEGEVFGVIDQMLEP